MNKRAILCVLTIWLFLVLPLGRSAHAEYSSEIVMTPDDRVMLAALEQDAGQIMERAICEDMNGDGMREIVGVCRSASGICRIWLGGNSMSKAKLLSESEYAADGMNLCAISLQEETHIAVNMHIGSEGVCSIVALRADGSAWLPLKNHPGEIRVGKHGAILCCIDVYEVDGVEGHQYIDTYLTYDGTQYLEYIAQEITTQEFLKYSNAKEYLAVIQCEADDASLKYQVFRRENGILEIVIYDNYDETVHYTLRYSDNSIYCNEGVSSGTVLAGPVFSCMQRGNGET